MSSLFDVKILDLVSSLHPRDSSGYSDNYNRYIEFLGNVFCPGVRGSAPLVGAGSGIRMGRDELFELVSAAGGCSSSRCGWSKESEGAQEGGGADVSVASGSGIEQSVCLVEKAVESPDDGCGGVLGADGDAGGQRVGDCVDVDVCGGHGLGGTCDSVSGVAGSDRDVSVGDSALSEGVVRGKNYLSNKKKRDQRKRRAKLDRMSGAWRRVDDGGAVSQNVPTLQEFVEARANEEILKDKAEALEQRLEDESVFRSAKRTLAEKWARENELAAEKAKRALDVLRAQDLQVEIKRQNTSMRLQTERNMVGMEKAHQFLKKTGNVPGFAQTVLSDEGLTDGSSASPVSPGECTISPDSSASMKEFRELVKRCADLEAKLDQFHKMTKIHPDYIELYKKQTWTINSENIRILDEMYPQGHALNPIPDYENYDAPTHGELIVGRDEEYFPY